MTTTTAKGVSTVHKADGLLEMFLRMTEEEFLIIWRFGGYEGLPPQDVDRRIVAMVKGMTPAGRRSVARAFVRAFAALPVQVRAALVAFLLSLGIRPAGIALPAPAPRALTPQRGWLRLTPARAP
ncbi:MULTISPECIES: hypothetical protein [Streptomycetaceae]|uniref:Uncharacterized protein n=3 Tax=Streptomyces TaxID=1883 RepID=A0A0N0XZN1_9ACTN|nr:MULTISPECIES: hypothetical protein [Streptomycetaceae]KPC66463.1 hypothetical protein ADL29_04185 [Streptomyces chattanoogensis]KUM82329.1 hypothetical protein AQI94_42160 [Streptomyces pseudovenezuelae]